MDTGERLARVETLLTELKESVAAVGEDVGGVSTQLQKAINDYNKQPAICYRELSRYADDRVGSVRRLVYRVVGCAVAVPAALAALVFLIRVAVASL